MEFKDIATKVINNAELKTALMNYIKSGNPNPDKDPALVPYENLITFQASECGSITGCIRPLEKYGYQVGEPWSGNIEKAHILFVSKSLAYTAQEICPRYIPNEALNDCYIAVTDRTQTVIDKGYPEDELIEAEDVIELCNTRFERAFLNNNSTLYVQTLQRNKDVLYWGSMRNNTESLLLPNVQSALTTLYGGKTVDYYKSIMEYVACASVVPYKVITQKDTPYEVAFNAGGTFQHCWNRFAKDLISLSLSEASAPKIVVLVGDDVLQVFQSSTTFSALQPELTETSQPDGNKKTHTIFLYKDNGNFIVNVRDNQGSMGSFANYFPKNSQILSILQAKFSALFNAHLNGIAKLREKEELKRTI